MLENIELFGNSLGVGTYPDGEGKSFLQNIFDVIHPVGEVYIQYPAQKSPQEIYNKKDANNRIIIDSVWEEQLQYNSAFFRSEHLLGSYIYKADDETQYYLIDNLNNLTPINIAGNNDVTIAGSPTSGQQKVIGDKTYQAYAVSGVNSSSDDYIKEGNALTKQAGQNLEHNHGMQHYHSMAHYHNRGSMNITGKFGASVPQNHANYCSGAFTSDNYTTKAKVAQISSSAETVYGYSFNASNSSSWTGLTSNVLNSNGSAITNSLTGGSVNSSASARTSTDNSGGSENRPDNYTIKIWKRVS